MKFTVSSTAMANKLAAMAKVMNGKSVLPILSTFLLEVKEDAPLEVTAARWKSQGKREQAKCASRQAPCWMPSRTCPNSR